MITLLWVTTFVWIAMVNIKEDTEGEVISTN